MTQLIFGVLPGEIWAAPNVEDISREQQREVYETVGDCLLALNEQDPELAVAFAGRILVQLDSGAKVAFGYSDVVHIPPDEDDLALLTREC